VVEGRGHVHVPERAGSVGPRFDQDESRDQGQFDRAAAARPVKLAGLPRRAGRPASAADRPEDLARAKLLPVRRLGRVAPRTVGE
jgi:hypothetical protein